KAVHPVTTGRRTERGYVLCEVRVTGPPASTRDDPIESQASETEHWALRFGPVVADPAGKALLAHFAGREGHHDRGGGLGRRREINAIEPKKNDQRCERGPLIAVHERMIRRNAEGIGRGKRGKIGFAVREFVDRPRQGGFEKPRITN